MNSLGHKMFFTNSLGSILLFASTVAAGVILLEWLNRDQDDNDPFQFI